ncbi:ribonuclease T2-like protein [Aspergillus pseudocaelatus]|uniref:Ribonuclease T2-like n=1 Tax=Aspergillus pseudocaelatus TaxID=1825620 RepID=A0ABQ6WXS2_9EURO|nr:ribonuclease T2-like protein [Aspergillus pseudocaelatus]
MFQGIPGPQQVLTALTGSLGLSSLLGPEIESSQSSFQHCSKAELSCQTPYHGQDKCCFNYPGGQFLQSQFWDADPAIGPEDSWTIHGLWPDYCNGGFPQYCDSKRRYSNISLILTDSGRGDLLDEMRTFWKDWKGDDPNLWEHEWNKHGTCISTLETHCYDIYYPQQDVVDYFDKTVELFHGLPTHEILAGAGIVPSYTETYSLSEIHDALVKAHGADVVVRCRHHNLNEAWYFFNVAGPLQTGKFIPANPDGQTSNCPSKGIRYQPKTPRKDEPTKTRGPSEPTSTGTPKSKRGNLVVSTQGQQRGCIISRGTWFTSGTCATFRIEKASDETFTLQSSKGKCSFEKDTFSCGPRIKNPVEFSIQDGKLSYQGNTTFFADKAPKGPTKSKIYASEEGHPIELTITWRGSH